MPPPLHLWLTHPDPLMSAAFRHRFANLPNVQIFQANFEQLSPHDYFVTAGNSFGIMTAGIDAAVIHFFGPDLMTTIQNYIRTHYLGEQPVGTAFLIPTRHPHIPYLNHAPTMRTPGSIDGTDKIYTATWAALLAIHLHNLSAIPLAPPITTVAFPAFGTGFGRVPFDEAARQMAAAYTHYLNPPTHLNWDTVIARQKAICYDGSKQVIRPT